MLLNSGYNGAIVIVLKTRPAFNPVKALDAVTLHDPVTVKKYPGHILLEFLFYFLS